MKNRKQFFVDLFLNWKAMQKFRIPCNKILVVGDGHVGKSSLTKRLKEVWFYPLRRSLETKGLDQHQLECGRCQHVTIWDFAGQDDFLATHRLFLKDNSIFIIVVKLTEEQRHTIQALQRWLFILDQQAPDSSVMVVGSHLDELGQNIDETEIFQKICRWLKEAMKDLSLKLVAMNQADQLNDLPDEQIVKSIILVSNKEDKNIHLVRSRLRECLRYKRVDIPDPDTRIYETIIGLPGDCIASEALLARCGSPTIDRFKAWLHFLERIGRILVLKSTDDIESWTIVLNADYLSKQYTKLREYFINTMRITYEDFCTALPADLRKRKSAFRELLVKCYLIYDDKKNGEIFLPECALNKENQIGFHKNDPFSYGRVLQFKSILPIGFFEQVAVSMLQLYGNDEVHCAKNFIQITTSTAQVIIEKMRAHNSEFENQLRILSWESKNSATSLIISGIALVMENIDNIIERLFGAERASNEKELKHCHLYPLIMPNNENGIQRSLLDHYASNGPPNNRLRGACGGESSLSDLLFEPLPLIKNFATMEESLGSGAYGKIFKGTYNGEPIAVKKIKYKGDLDLKEITILRLIGVDFDVAEKTAFLVTEELECSLHHLIFVRKVNLLADIPLFKQIALDIAHGIKYMHSQQPALIHRDLKCSNILLYENMTRAKIADFGTARWVTSSFLAPHGTEQYQAPEMQSLVTIKADIFSFGAIVYEMCHDGSLNSGLFDRNTLEYSLLTRAIPDWLKQFVRKCCLDKERPLIDECIKMLKE